MTHDLHEHTAVGFMTDYEAKFVAQGMRINRLEAARTDRTLGTAAGEPPRLRNASLTDAAGYAASVRDNGGNAT